jgi:hypothetical protein
LLLCSPLVDYTTSTPGLGWGSGSGSRGGKCSVGVTNSLPQLGALNPGGVGDEVAILEALIDAKLLVKVLIGDDAVLILIIKYLSVAVR